MAFFNSLLAERLPADLINTLREQNGRLAELDVKIAHIERRLLEWHRQDPDSMRIAAVPGIGLLSDSYCRNDGRPEGLQIRP